MKVRIHYIVLLIMFLGLITVVNNPTGAYLDDGDFYYDNVNVSDSTISPWDIITIQVTNEDANSDASSIEKHQINLNSSSDTSGIYLTLTETGANTSVFSTDFQVAETASSNQTTATYPYPRLNATDGDVIQTELDLDSDGQSEKVNMTFDYSDKIYVFRNKNPSGVGQDSKPEPSQRYFAEDSTVYITVYSKAGWSGPNATAFLSTNSSQNISISLSESSNYPGKYTGSFTINQDQTTNNSNVNASDSQRINLESDIGNDLKYMDSFVIVDNTAPAFVSITPGNDTAYHGNNTRTIQVTISESYPSFANLILHYWRLNATEDANNNDQIDLGEKKSTTMVFQSGSTFSASIDDSMVPSNGPVYMWVTGTDQAGNALTGGGSWNDAATTYSIDETAPTISFENTVHEEADSSFNLRANLNGTYSSLSITNYTIFRSDSNLISNSLNCSSEICNLSAAVTTIDLPTGLLNLTIFAKDEAGNAANSTLEINSTAGVRRDNSPTVIGSQDVPNDGESSVRIEFNVTLKGSYLKMKVSDFSSGSNIFDIDASCSGTCASLQYNTSSGAQTVDVASSYSSSGQTTNIVDQGSMNYAKDVSIYLIVTIPEALSPGTYNGTYSIQAYG